MAWRVDEGLGRLDQEWRAEWPDAVIYHIGDSKHDTDPDVSQHAPDDGGPKPGDDKGEVDAGDYMPGSHPRQPNADDLDDAFRQLIASRDKRILYLIRRDKIVSSVVHPWIIRPYGGHYHTHLHVSVNDNYDNNQSDWKWENMAEREYTTLEMTGKLPILMRGDEDAAHAGWDHVVRFQALANICDGSLPDLVLDGVYGSKGAQKMARIMGGKGTTSNGTKIGEAEWRKLIGFSK